jgi:hypothetical protein
VSAVFAGLAVVLTVAACSPGLATASHPASGGASTAKYTVKTTIDGLTTLPGRVHWQAFPSVPPADVFAVDFLIDNRLGWTERVTPYFYGNDGNWLVTSFLSPGVHRFTVRVTTFSRHTATDTVQASVTSPAAPPAALAGTWKRVVTPAEVTEATVGGATPAGLWRLQISSVGWQLHDPNGGVLLFDVGYRPHVDLQMRPAIDYPPYPQNDQGGFCTDTDPQWTWTYSAADGGTTLTLRPVGHDPCPDRAAILAGTWIRTGA